MTAVAEFNRLRLRALMAKTIAARRAAKKQSAELVALAVRDVRVTIARASKPVAQPGSAPKAKRRRLPSDDPLLNLNKSGFNGPGSKLTNAELDRVVCSA